MKMLELSIAKICTFSKNQPMAQCYLCGLVRTKEQDDLIKVNH